MNKLFLLSISFVLMLGLATSCAKKFDENLQKEMQAEQAATEAAVKTAESMHTQMVAQLGTPEAKKMDAAILKSNADKMRMHQVSLEKAKEQIAKNAELIAKHEKKEMKVEEVKTAFEEMKTADAGIMSSIKSMNADHDIIKAAMDKIANPRAVAPKPAQKGKRK